MAHPSNPFAIVLAIPLLNKLVYPFLEARKVPHGPVRRVVMGFILAAAGMLWCALLQYAVRRQLWEGRMVTDGQVYMTSPCGFNATTCEEGVSPLVSVASLYTPVAGH